MTTEKLTKDSLSKVTGGINQLDGLKLADMLSNYYKQGRLGITTDEFVTIYQTFVSGDNLQISRVFSTYMKPDSDPAWMEMLSLFSSFI